MYVIICTSVFSTVKNPSPGDPWPLDLSVLKFYQLLEWAKSFSLSTDQALIRCPVNEMELLPIAKPVRQFYRQLRLLLGKVFLKEIKIDYVSIFRIWNKDLERYWYFNKQFAKFMNCVYVDFYAEVKICYCMHCT